MVWLKGCPRCRGDLFEEPAVGALGANVRFVNCLQCGHSLSDQEERNLRHPGPRRAVDDSPRVA